MQMFYPQYLPWLHAMRQDNEANLTRRQAPRQAPRQTSTQGGGGSRRRQKQLSAGHLQFSLLSTSSWKAKYVAFDTWALDVSPPASC